MSDVIDCKVGNEEIESYFLETAKRAKEDGIWKPNGRKEKQTWKVLNTSLT